MKAAPVLQNVVGNQPKLVPVKNVYMDFDSGLVEFRGMTVEDALSIYNKTLRSERNMLFVRSYSVFREVDLIVPISICVSFKASDI